MITKEHQYFKESHRGKLGFVTRGMMLATIAYTSLLVRIRETFTPTNM